MSFHVITAIKT